MLRDIPPLVLFEQDSLKVEEEAPPENQDPKKKGIGSKIYQFIRNRDKQMNKDLHKWKKHLF